MSNIFEIIGELAEGFARLKMDIAKVQYVLDRSVRYGRVTDVDPAKGLARIQFAEKDSDKPKSAWVPYFQHVGTDKKFKRHEPPVVDQQMAMIAPNGEFRQAFLIPLTRHDEAASPGQGADANVEQWDKTKVEFKADQHTTTVENSKHDLKPNEQILETLGQIFKMEAGKVTLTTDMFVVASGDIRLGGEGADKAVAMLGTIDSAGHTDVSGLSSVVKTM